MCGLIALLGTPSSTFTLGTLRPGLTHMHPRGPDAEGVWQESGVWLGHRRLAILDLDVRSNQPLHSAWIDEGRMGTTQRWWDVAGDGGPRHSWVCEVAAQYAWPKTGPARS